MVRRPRKSGIDVVGDLPWGTHICHFYETQDDLLDILIPFFNTGLENNEFCLWIVFDPLPKEEAGAALRQAVPDLDRRLEAGDIEILSHSEWYLKGGTFDLQRTIRGWKEKLASALASGYAGMRVNGNASWLNETQWQESVAYEAELNRILPGMQMIVICTYPLAVARGTKVFDVARTHEFAIARLRGRWEVVETPELLQAKEEVTQLNTELEQRVMDRTSELAASNRALSAEIEGRRRLEIDLLKQNEILQKIFDHIPVMISFFDEEGRLRLANREFARVLGWSFEEIMERNVDILAECYPDPKDRRCVRDFIARSGGEWADFRTTTRDGRVIDTTWAMVPLSDGMTITIGRDTTERKVLEEQLRQAQKMEAIGRLAGGIAHDFNNLLTAVIGYCELATAKLTNGDPLEDYIAHIRTAGDRAAELTHQLLAFSRKQVLQPKLLNLNSVVTGIEGLLRRLIGEDVRLRTVLAADLGTVEADPGQIEQVIVNLAVNARDAMPGGEKTLTIETGNLNSVAGSELAHLAVDQGNYVTLAVSDTGRGMDKQTMSHLFEPFFTTKDLGKGTGLGLATVYGIVKQSGGSISVYSEPGRGSKFKIYLPRVESGGDHHQSTAEPELARQGTETLLLAEDDEIVRILIAEVLRAYGYQVLEASGPAEALLIGERHPGPIHLLVSDVIMPEMNGPELSSRLQKLRPDAKVLYMSGYTDGGVVQQGMLEETNFIQKPFVPDALLRRVREILDQA
jgi:two-component system, cell cycle sensor histidine kinase and response regulator CckA